ncbi:hypothetical protein B7463_g9800, partial [Scytalidium lignicola]
MFPSPLETMNGYTVCICINIIKTAEYAATAAKLSNIFALIQYLSALREALQSKRPVVCIISITQDLFGLTVNIIKIVKLLLKFDDVVLKAIQACGGVVQKVRRADLEDPAIRRRQADSVLTCAFQHSSVDTEAGGTFDSFIAVEEWQNVGITVAQTAPAVLTEYLTTLSADEATKAIFSLAMFSVVLDSIENSIISGSTASLSPEAKMNMPTSGFATNPPPKGCTGNEPIASDSFLCIEYVCQGEDTGLCTVDPNVNCPCILTILPVLVLRAGIKVGSTFNSSGSLTSLMA